LKQQGFETANRNRPSQDPGCDLTNWGSRNWGRAKEKAHQARRQLKEMLYSVFNPNVVKNSYRRVGCAHQMVLNLNVEGGHSPPYSKNTGINRREIQQHHCDLGLSLYF